MWTLLSCGDCTVVPPAPRSASFAGSPDGLGHGCDDASPEALLPWTYLGAITHPLRSPSGTDDCFLRRRGRSFLGTHQVGFWRCRPVAGPNSTSTPPLVLPPFVFPWPRTSRETVPRWRRCLVKKRFWKCGLLSPLLGVGQLASRIPVPLVEGTGSSEPFFRTD